MPDKIDNLTINDSSGTAVSYDLDLPVDNTTRINTCYTLTGLSTVAGSATSGAYKSVRWYTSNIGNDLTAPYDGMKVMIKVPLAGVSTAGVILSINGNNDDDYHPVAYNVNTVLTTHYPVNTYKIFVYDASATMTCYKASGTAVTITGVWKGESNYDSNTTTTYGTLDYYFRPYAGANRITRYKLVALDKDNRAIPITTEQYIGDYAASTTYAKDEVVLSSSKYYKSLQASNKGHTPASSTTWWQEITPFTPNSTPFKPNKIWFMNTTGAYGPNAVLGGQVLTEVGYSTAGCTYNFTGGIPAYRLIYLRGIYDKTTGLFTLDTTSNTSYFTSVPDNTANITLSSYFTSGKDYILVGATYSSANYFQIFIVNTMYHFDGTNLLPYDTWDISQSSGSSDNQRIKTSSVTFDSDAVVEFEGGSHVTITGNSSTNKMTLGVESGYSIPSTTAQTNWSNKQDALPTTTTANKILTSTATAGTTKWTDGALSTSDTKPLYLSSSGVMTAGKTYAGGTAVTLNNSSKAESTASFYAPTAGGASKALLVGAGTTSAPTWSSSTTWSESAGFLKVDASGIASVDTNTYVTSSGVTSVTAGAGLNTTSDDTTTDGGTITSQGTLYLTKTAVTPGTYQGITVDKYGRVTGASNQGYGTGSVTSITIQTSGTGLSGGSATAITTTGTRTISLDSSAEGNRTANKVVLAKADGQINSEKYAVTSSGTTKATMQYDATDDAIKFIFS